MKSRLTSSVEDWESFSSRDDMGCTEHSSNCSTEIDDPRYLRRTSQFDFGYTEQFCIPGVTSVFFSSCDSVVGDFLEFNQANRGSLYV